MRLVTEDKEVAPIPLRAAQAIEEQLEKDAPEDVVLQTKIVSPQEVRCKPEIWRAAILAEVKSLFETKEALKTIEGKEARQLIKDFQIQAIPSRVVFTLKPEAGNLRGKRKCRIVACGNFATDDGGDYFAAGTNAAALRIALAYSSHKKWYGFNLDIKTAFLNAPMARSTSDDDDENGLKRTLLRPPSILVPLGYFGMTPTGRSRRPYTGSDRHPDYGGTIEMMSCGSWRPRA